MNRYLPDVYSKNVLSINYDKLKKKKIKCLIFDLDNTLVPIHTEKIGPKIKALITKLKKDFLVIIVSNSPKKRVNTISEVLQVDAYPNALKPLTRTLRKIKKKYNLTSQDIAMIGDQFITDMNYGYKGKLLKVFVDTISNEDLKITSLNRFFEKKIMHKYQKDNLFKKGEYYDER